MRKNRSIWMITAISVLSLHQVTFAQFKKSREANRSQTNAQIKKSKSGKAIDKSDSHLQSPEFEDFESSKLNRDDEDEYYDDYEDRYSRGGYSRGGYSDAGYSEAGYSQSDQAPNDEPEEPESVPVRQAAKRNTQLYPLDPGPLSVPPPPPPDLESACCVEPIQFWTHGDAVWAEFIFLRPRGADVTYATPVDGTLSTSVPLGNQAVAAFDYQSGFRAGGAWAIDPYSSVTANYMWYQADSEDNIHLAGGSGTFIRAETVHPSTVNVAADSLAARAFYELRVQAVDANYKSLLWGGDDYAVNYLVGAKYAHLDQQFGGRYTILGTTTVDTDVDFDGAGPRFGFEGERLFRSTGLLAYSKGAVNFLCGSSSAEYLQTNVFTGIQAQTGFQQTRIVTMPELEVGAGWQNCNGRFRITAGYYLAAWFNMLTTPEYLSTVRVDQNSFQHQIQTLTLDGLNVRAEVRF